MTVLTILAWPLLGLSALGLVVWTIVAFRVWRETRRAPTVRRGIDLPAPSRDGRAAWPAVSVVVPAHDEERVIDRCATSLRGQAYDDLELIFVLDRCTDGTLDILRRHQAEDPRVILVENDRCPDDWAGKCHAARLGAERARGAYLLFADADTWMAPGLVRAAVALAHERDLGLLSLLSTLTFDHLYERVVQPVASMMLVRMYPMERVNRREGARPFANGQFMLFERGWYERIGGHAGVKDDLLEDLAFARRLDDHGGHGGVFLADGMLHCSMYDSLPAMRVGWKRIFIEACKRKPARLRRNGWMTIGKGVVLPIAQAAALAVGAGLVIGGAGGLGALVVTIAALAVLLQGWTLARAYAMCGAPAGSMIFYPLGCWVVGRVMLDGASDLVRRRPIAWGGREYVLRPRS